MGRRAWLRVVAASVRSRTTNPRTLLVRSLSAVLLALAEAIGMVLLIDRFGTVAGWTSPEIVLMYGLGVAGQGLAQTLCNQLEPVTFSPMVRDGLFDQVLVRPARALAWLMATGIDPRYLVRTLAGLGLVLWGADRAGVAWSPPTAGVAALGVCCCAALIVAMFTLGAAATLRTVEGNEAVQIITFGGIYLASFPMEIYGSALRLVFTWLLPFALTIYVPALALLGRAGAPGLAPSLLVLTPAVTAATCALAALGWTVGIRRYLGTGS